MQMKMNKLESALIQLPEQFKSISFNKELKESESNHFHVLHLKQTHIPAEKRYSTDVKVGVYQKESWKQIKGNLTMLGYEHNYILHDPDFVSTVKEEVIQEEVVVEEDSSIQKAQQKLSEAIEGLKEAKESGDESKIKSAEAKAKRAETALNKVTK